MTNAERIEELLRQPKYARLLQLAIERKEIYDDDPHTEDEMPLATALEEVLDAAESWASDDAGARRELTLGRDLLIEAGFFEDVTEAVANGSICVSHGKPYEFRRKGRKYACRASWSCWIEK